MTNPPHYSQVDAAIAPIARRKTPAVFSPLSGSASRHVEIGVFLPIAKNGFIRSRHAPEYVPSYKENLEIALMAESVGFDYVFTMLKWRGFGGATQFWDSSFDSFSIMSALAAATTRVKLIATVSPVLLHPVPMAKMAATVDDVSGGRLGLNIVTGSTMSEYTQMGVLPPGYESNRYEYATEWVHVLKRLWSERSVTHKGRFFTLDDCVSAPKPVSSPHPFLVCAGSSEQGFRFSAENVDYSFLNGSDADALRTNALSAKQIAASQGRALKTATPVMIVLGDTDASAESYWAHLEDGADVDATTNQAAAQSNDPRRRVSKERNAALLADRRKIISGLTLFIGGPQRVANGLLELIQRAELDSIVLLFPDYVDGMRRFADGVLPILRGAIEVGAPSAAPSVDRAREI